MKKSIYVHNFILHWPVYHNELDKQPTSAPALDRECNTCTCATWKLSQQCRYRLHLPAVRLNLSNFPTFLSLLINRLHPLLKYEHFLSRDRKLWVQVQLQLQHGISMAPLYDMSRNVVRSHGHARSKRIFLSRFLKVLVWSVMSCKSDGRLFHGDGPQQVKPRSPNLVVVLGSRPHPVSGTENSGTGTSTVWQILWGLSVVDEVHLKTELVDDSLFECSCLKAVIKVDLWPLTVTVEIELDKIPII